MNNHYTPDEYSLETAKMLAALGIPSLLNNLSPPTITLWEFLIGFFVLFNPVLFYNLIASFFK